jgi:hypothetical protein
VFWNPANDPDLRMDFVTFPTFAAAVAARDQLLPGMVAMIVNGAKCRTKVSEAQRRKLLNDQLDAMAARRRRLMRPPATETHLAGMTYH